MSSEYTRAVGCVLHQLANGWEDYFSLPFEPGYQACRPYEPNDLCGGCDGCMMMQACHGLDLLEQDNRRHRRIASAHSGFVFARARTSAAELSAAVTACRCAEATP